MQVPNLAVSRRQLVHDLLGYTLRYFGDEYRYVQCDWHVHDEEQFANEVSIYYHDRRQHAAHAEEEAVVLSGDVQEMMWSG